MKILVVEDSRTNLAILSRQVERFGSTAMTAETGERALEIFTRSRPDLMLLDVILPHLDGIEVARRMRVLATPGERTPPIVRGMQRLVLMRTSLVASIRKLDAANRELVRLSAIDGLTGVANRRFFDEALDTEWRRARRNSNSLAILMCDVDYFKAFNDTYGHQAGDDCLRKIAQAIQHSTGRPSDVVGRYGGEEFAVILPETPQGGALMVAEKARHAVRELNVPHAASPSGVVTLSIGIAAAAPGFDNPPDDLIQSADKALYRAKNEGRDRVCRADAV